jgi:hypothetical protein
MKTILGYLFIAVLVVTVVAAVLLFTPLGERPFTALFTVGDAKTVDFADLTEIPRVGSPVCTYAYPESDATFVKGGGSKFVDNFYAGEFLEYGAEARDRLLVAT